MKTTIFFIVMILMTIYNLVSTWKYDNTDVVIAWATALCWLIVAWLTSDQLKRYEKYFKNK